MTDKQIIIDGVDVSGCRFYSEKLSTMNGTGSISVTKCNGFCTHNIRGLDDSSCYDIHIEYAKCENNNCYYKQLKAENETLSKAIEEVNKINKRLESEIDELKKQLESTKGLVTVGNKQLAEALEGYNDLKNELHSKVEFIQEQRNVIDEYSKEIEMYKRCQGSRASKREEKLKQTLAEIKEVAEKLKNFYEELGKCEDLTVVRLKQILHKIYEVEDEKI